jgi:rod shape-determining protein MreC
VLPDERVKPGETVVTSGGDQIFPRGLPVGTVEKVVSDPDREPYVDIVLKPAANLQHLDEVLVITEIGAAVPEATERDMAKSQAVGGEQNELKRASDVLAERLPGLQPVGGAAADGAKADAASDEFTPVPQPLPALHADRYSPGAVPPAQEMTPGKGFEMDRQTVQPPARRAPPKRPADGADAAGEAPPPAHAVPQSFLIPGTATDAAHPITNPERTARAPVSGPVSTAGSGAPPRERR